MFADKARIRFRKSGDLRLVSHHDLMRCWERMLRRAALPFHSTSGFNPKPRLIFAMSLALGIVGCAEVAELELDQEIEPDVLRESLRKVAPAGLDILEVRRVDKRRRAGAQVRRVGYRLPLPIAENPELVAKIDALLANSEVCVDRTFPQPRRVNLRPYIDALRIKDHGLEMDLWVTPNGSARPDEILSCLGLETLLTEGAVLERTWMELHDEADPTHESTILNPQAIIGNQSPSASVPAASGSNRQASTADQEPHSLMQGPLDF